MSASIQDIYDLLLVVDAKVNLSLRRQSREERELMSFSDDLKARLDTLTANVTTMTSAVDGAEALVNGLVATITDLKSQLANAGVDPTLLISLDQASGAISAKAAELAAAVTANTTAAPAV
jgi:hypothetical protein